MKLQPDPIHNELLGYRPQSSKRVSTSEQNSSTFVDYCHARPILWRHGNARTKMRNHVCSLTSATNLQTYTFNGRQLIGNHPGGIMPRIKKRSQPSTSFYISRRRIGNHQCHRTQRIKNRSPKRAHKYTYEQTHMQGLSLHAWLCTEDDLTAWTVIDVSRPQSKFRQRPLMTNAKTCIQTRSQQ